MTPFVYCSVPARFFQACKALFGSCLLLFALAGCGGGGGGGVLSGAGPVVLVDGTGRIDEQGTESSSSLVTERGPDQPGVRTPGTVADPRHYETAEYHAGGRKAPLAATSFSAAYARGWTGLGSVVTVADTGIDDTHPDLAPAIIGNRDFTGSGLADTHGHGTHVAGIVAARRDGAGMHGGAFDAQLLIGKVAAGRSYDFSLARQAADWGRAQDSVAVNVSAAYLRDPFLESRLVRLGEGSYFLDDPWYGYGETGFYGVKSQAAGWRAALGSRQVLVKAAGNSGTDYSAGFNQLATATDDNGVLLLNRQMLIVGNWDAASRTIIGNRAGNVCTTWRNGACLDAATISDSFIMAPGTDVSSTYPGGGYASMTGTSMAAPVVATLALLRRSASTATSWHRSFDSRQVHPGIGTYPRAGSSGYGPRHTPVGETGFPLGASVSEARVPMAGGGAMKDFGNGRRGAVRCHAARRL